MRKLVFLSILISVGIVTLNAAKISKQEALVKAENFLSSKSSTRSGSDLYGLMVSSFEDEVYIINYPQGGWVLISADDRVPEMVLGYSESGTLYPEALPKGIAAILDNFAFGIANMEVSVHPSTIPLTRSDTEVAPLLGEIAWDQGYPYNAMCPFLEEVGERALVGCVSTAEAQIMYYHHYPLHGTGEYSYEWKGTEYYMDFSKSEYKWDLMKPFYDGTESQEAIDAVAKLNYDVAISNSSMFGSFGTATGASLYGYPLVTFFDYDPSVIYIDRTRCTRQYYEDTLRAEILSGRPVYMQASNEYGGGHAFVCDGFNSEGYFHYNMGGGSGGYFLSSATGWDVTPSMICSIKPNEGGAPGIWVGSSKHFMWTESDNISCLLRGDITSQVAANIEVALALEDKSSGTVQYFVKLKDYSVFFELTDLIFNDRVDDGEYLLYPVYRINGSDWKNICFVDNAADHIDLSVKDGVKTYINDTSGGVQDEDVELIDGIYYRFDDEEAMVCARNNMGYSYSGDVIIPSEVEFEGKTYPVTSIDQGAFMSSTVNSVYIGENVRKIGFAAFKESTIGKLTFAEGSKLVSTGDQVFYACHIEELIFPEGLESMSFLMCGSCFAKRIDIPASVTYMSSWSIHNENDGLEDLTVHWTSADQLPQYGDRALDGNLTKTVLHVPSGCTDIYRNHELWSVFDMIKDDADSGVENIWATDWDINVTTENGHLIFESIPEGTIAEVYSVQGLLLGKYSSGESIALGKGLYLVRIGKKIVKIML